MALFRCYECGKELAWGTIGLFTAVVLVLVIRGVTHQPNSMSVATSPTPATAELATRSPVPVETASQSSPSITTAETPAAEATTTSSLPVEATSQSSPSITTAETPTA